MPPEVGALTPAARRILDAASELFYARGITAVGVDLVAERSGVTKRTLYDRFGSKDALVTAYLAERDRRWRAVVVDAVEAARTPVERLLAPFDALVSWSSSSPRGCAFVNALAELPDPQHPAHRIAAEEKEWLLELFVRLADEAGVDSSREVATSLLLLHEGALAMLGSLPGTDGVGAARRTARDVVSG